MVLTGLGHLSKEMFQVSDTRYPTSGCMATGVGTQSSQLGACLVGQECCCPCVSLGVEEARTRQACK